MHGRLKEVTSRVTSPRGRAVSRRGERGRWAGLPRWPAARVRGKELGFGPVGLPAAVSFFFLCVLSIFPFSCFSLLSTTFVLIVQKFSIKFLWSCNNKAYQMEPYFVMFPTFFEFLNLKV